MKLSSSVLSKPFSMPLDSVGVGRALALLDEGYSQREVSRILNVARTTLSDNIRRYQETGSCKRRPGSGLTRCTTARDDRFMVMETLRNRFQTSVETARRLYDVRNVLVNPLTVRRRLREAHIIPRRPYNAPELLTCHRRARLQFATEHIRWTEEDWDKVLFSDETRISLRGADGRVRVYRRRNERYSECALVPRVAFDGGSIMVWGGISAEAHTDLVFFDGASMNAESYISNVLEDMVVPYAPFIGDGFLFWQDNARPHVARTTREYMQLAGITTVNPPARSPDLNPIEHTWDSLKRRVRAHDPAPRTLRDLKDVIVQEWNNIPQAEHCNLIYSLPRRLQDVIRARGGNTRY